MKTRNSATPKPAAAKKTPPARKSAVKTPPNPPRDSGIEFATPKTTEADFASASETTPTASADPKTEHPVEQAKPPADAVEVIPESKVGTGAKAKKTVVRKTVVRKTTVRTKTPTSAKAALTETPKSDQTEKLKIGESSEKEVAVDQSFLAKFEESAKKEEPPIENVEETKRLEDQNVMYLEDPPQEKEEITDVKPEQPVEHAKASAVAGEVTPETKVPAGAKTTKTVVRETTARSKTPTSAKAVTRKTPKSEQLEKTPKLEQTEKLKVGESSKEEGGDTMDVGSAKIEESSISAEEPAKKEGPSVENVEETKKVEDQNVMNDEDSPQEKEEIIDEQQRLVPNIGESARQEDPVASVVAEVSESQEPATPREEKVVKEEMREEMRIIEDNLGPKNESVNMEEDVNNELRAEEAQLEDEYQGNERMEECRDQEVLLKFGEEELAADDVPEHGEEAEAFEEEHIALTAAAKEHKIRKELEIFVGGLDCDAVEEDVKKPFENIGDVVEVRLHKNSLTDKNKAYAFVKFATKEQASQVLSEMKDPLIRGKRCWTASSEDNDSLFLGNICNTWTKDAIKQKLKDYGVEGVEDITLVPDARHEGLSRGFAFIEFSCHADAILAYKRLQKPDVIFGHPERTAKVAFAEPLREPDPEVMAQVKSVFIDGLPPHVDEDRVREQMKGYGEIVRIMLARNMSTAKRKDYGFVDFTTHEAAVACVGGINNKNFGDGNSKTKVKARLSNPLPKTQAIKGGMRGGLRIGRAGAGSFSKSGRGFGRDGHAFNRPNFQRGRGFYQRGNVQAWRMGFNRERDLDIQYPPFQRREMSGPGGWRDSFGGARDASSGHYVPARPNLERVRHDAPDRGHGMPVPPRRHPFPPGEGFNRAFGGRHFDDPYFYDESARGIKRPFFMTDPDYLEPSRHRPRLDYSDPAVPFHAPRYRDSFGAGSSLPADDYYGYDYGEGSYSAFYGNDHPYGGGYYY